MRKLVARALIVAVIGAAAVMMIPGVASSDPDLTNVMAHRHYIVTPTGQFIAVGPDLCDNPNMQNAFNQFHNNLHMAGPGSIGPAAPGLHNSQGGELVARGCSFVPPS
jgi:hypothetical protein